MEDQKQEGMNEENTSLENENESLNEEHQVGDEEKTEEPLAQCISLTEELQEKLKEKEEQFLRAVADLENYRRRSKKEMEELVKYASLPLVESLLPVLDNFERALESVDKNEGNKSLFEGVEMVYRQLQSALKNVGLSSIEAQAKPFDPHQHNAVMQEEHKEMESGMVIEELQSGYRFLERVIRPSMVKVSK